MPFSFPPERRVRHKQEFQAIFDKRQRISGQFYLVFFRKNQLTFGRMGIIVSKRNVHRAVDRNRVKRVAREIYRLQQQLLSGIDIVLIAKFEARKAAKAELKPCLNKLFQQLITRCK